MASKKKWYRLSSIIPCTVPIPLHMIKQTVVSSYAVVIDEIYDIFHVSVAVIQQGGK